MWETIHNLINSMRQVPNISAPMENLPDMTVTIYKVNINLSIYRFTAKYKSHLDAHSCGGLACETCGMKFVWKNNYDRHVKEQHGNETITCDVCSSTFKSIRILKEHMRGLHGSTPHICDKCGKSYNWRRSLIRHNKTCK